MSDQPILRVLNGERLKKPPCWFMRQAGRYLPEYRKTRSQFKYFKDFLFSTPDIVDVTLQPLRRFDLDAAIIFSDILVVPMILGEDVDVVESKGPQLSKINTPEDIQRLFLKGHFEKCLPIYEAINKVRSQLEKNKSLIGFAGGPWTLASYMIEGQTSKTFAKTKNFGYQWPEAFQNLLNIISDITADHLINQIDAGADLIKIFDSWAGSIPYNRQNEWLVQPHKRLVERVKLSKPHIPIISFNKGLETSYNAYIENVSVQGVAMGSSTNIEWAAKNLSSHVALQGAMDPQLLVVGGKSMICDIEKHLITFKDRPYIFNLGHGIVPETPFENVKIVLDTIDRMCA